MPASTTGAGRPTSNATVVEFIAPLPPWTMLLVLLLQVFIEGGRVTAAVSFFLRGRDDGGGLISSEPELSLPSLE
jgi:hypothetical protein